MVVLLEFIVWRVMFQGCCSYLMLVGGAHVNVIMESVHSVIVINGGDGVCCRCDVGCCGECEGECDGECDGDV